MITNHQPLQTKFPAKDSPALEVVGTYTFLVNDCLNKYLEKKDVREIVSNKEIFFAACCRIKTESSDNLARGLFRNNLRDFRKEVEGVQSMILESGKENKIVKFYVVPGANNEYFLRTKKGLFFDTVHDKSCAMAKDTITILNKIACIENSFFKIGMESRVRVAITKDKPPEKFTIQTLEFDWHSENLNRNLTHLSVQYLIDHITNKSNNFIWKKQFDEPLNNIICYKLFTTYSLKTVLAFFEYFQIEPEIYQNRYLNTCKMILSLLKLSLEYNLRGLKSLCIDRLGVVATKDDMVIIRDFFNKYKNPDVLKILQKLINDIKQVQEINYDITPSTNCDSKALIL